MRTLKLSLLAASKPMTAWLASIQRSPSQGEGRGTSGQPLEWYAFSVFQFLAAFRFVSFSLGIGLVFVSHPGQPLTMEFFLAVALAALAGVYTIGRVIWRPDPTRHRVLVDIATLGLDLVLSVGLVVLTGGLDSGFLIYSLAPILTAGLLMDARTSLAAGAIAALSVLGGYLAAGLGLGGFPWVLNGNYLTLSLLYAAICLMTGILPFLANLNWQRRLRTLEDSDAQLTRG